MPGEIWHWPGIFRPLGQANDVAILGDGACTLKGNAAIVHIDEGVPDKVLTGLEIVVSVVSMRVVGVVSQLAVIDGTASVYACNILALLERGVTGSKDLGRGHVRVQRGFAHVEPEVFDGFAALGLESLREGSSKLESGKRDTR